MDTLTTALGQYQLQRLPLKAKEDLRAWDAADELLLNHISDQALLSKDQRILLINDQFGSLACSLNQKQIKHTLQSWGDSLVSHLAYQHNSHLNRQTSNVTAIKSTESLEGNFDLILIKVPKVLGLLEHQLSELRAHITAQTTIIAAGMSKHIHTSTLTLFERYLGRTQTSLATKKARLIFAQLDDNPCKSSPYPTTYFEPTLQLQISNHANVFSKEKLDIGARFLIEQLDKLPRSQKIIDLGCGNGVLGISAQRIQPDAQIHFIDESYMALDSAKTNYATAFEGFSNSVFHSSNCLDQYQGEPVDLILCNPPFHQQHTIGDHIAWQMFKQSYQQLQKGGELWVVANRHLGYSNKLKKIFGHCQTIANNNKFVVIKAQRTTANSKAYHDH